MKDMHVLLDLLMAEAQQNEVWRFAYSPSGGRSLCRDLFEMQKAFNESKMAEQVKEMAK